MAVQTQGLRQVQKQTQSLVLAPQLRQSLKILQVPTLELRSAILEELQTNPLLEEIGSNDESLDSTEVEPSPDEVHEQEVDDFPDEVENPGDEQSKEEIDFDIDAKESSDSEDLDFSDEFAILKEMQEDLKEHFEREYEGEAQLGNSDAEEKRKFFFDSLVADTSLQEHLLDQLKLADSTESIQVSAKYIIGSLDENGFVSSSLSDMALVSGLPLSDLQSALELLQTFDPPGIAALDLQDSLLKQMEIRNLDHTLPYQIVRDHFQLLVRRRVPELSCANFLNPRMSFINACRKSLSLILPRVEDFRMIIINQSHLMQLLKK